MQSLRVPDSSPLAQFLWGKDRLQRRRELLEVLSSHPTFSRNVNLVALSRKDFWTIKTEQSVELLDLKFKLGWNQDQFLHAVRLVGDVMPVGVSSRIFLKNLLAQMSPEQQSYWIPLTEKYAIHGTYAQTELGHGSNVQGIETTATFDSHTDEFILHSPTVSSAKYWIGALGVWATHALVIARLVVKGKDLGNHVFIVQIRDLETHDLTGDVIIYEQGAKAMGTFAGMDNGVMMFNSKRIPRSHLLAGMVSLDRDGTYHAAKNLAHAYTSMVIIRGIMIVEISEETLRAIVIAIKYTDFRRQFNKTDGREKRVIEYASVKQRLYPALARAVAMMLLGREIKTKVDNLLNANIEDLHLQTVGAKIWVTEHAVRDVEVARLSCGGHGNMANARLGSIYAALSPSRTYEGDTYVLSIQIGRAVVKYWKQNTENDFPALSFLGRLREPQPFSRKLDISHAESWFSPKIQEDVLEYRAMILASRHLSDTARQKDTSYDTFELTMAYADLTFWRSLQTQISNGPAEYRNTLQAMAQVFSLTMLLGCLPTFAGHTYLSLADITHLRTAHDTAIESFTPHLATIVAALGFTDFELDSVLCPSDERTPYEALFQVAKESELSDNRFIRPVMLRARNLWRKYEMPAGSAKL